MDGEAIYVGGFRLMSVAMTNHMLTTATARRNLGWTQQEATLKKNMVPHFCVCLTYFANIE